MGRRKVVHEKPEVKYLKSRVLENFRHIEEDLLEIAKLTSDADALRFGLNVAHLSMMGFGDRYEAVMKL